MPCVKPTKTTDLSPTQLMFQDISVVLFVTELKFIYPVQTMPEKAAISDTQLLFGDTIKEIDTVECELFEAEF